MAIYHYTGRAPDNAAPTGVDLSTCVTSAKSDVTILRGAEAPIFLANAIGKTICELLLQPVRRVKIFMSLSDLGLDSLVGVEFRAWWRRVFEFDVSVLEMLGAGTLEALGKMAADALANHLLGGQ